MSDILLHGKAQKPLLLKTMPAHNIGSDGNFAISTISGKGVFLSAKTNGRWFSAGKMEELKTFDNKTIDNISTKILKVRKEISMGDSFKLNSNSLSVSTGDFAINSNENVLLNSDTAIDGNLDISGIQTITSKTKLTNGLMSNPHLNLKYDDKNYVKFGTIKSGGLQIEPYKVDDVSGVTVGPIKLMYDETYYTTFQNDSSGNFTLASTGNATLDVAGDIELNADGGQVTIKDGAASHYLFDCDFTRFIIYDDINSNVLFKISAGQNGVSTISTNDNDGTAGHLILQPDGQNQLICRDGAEGVVIINSEDIENIGVGVHLESGESTKMRLYESGGDSQADYLEFKVEEHGLATISTIDAAAAAAHLKLVPDGDLILDPASQKTIINTTDSLFFDGGTDTYITESAGDILDFYVGAKKMLALDEANSKITLSAANLVAAIADGTEYSATNSA